MKIDTSMLPFGKHPPLRDRAYLNSAQGAPCDADDSHDRATVIKAHISLCGTAGMATKAPDDLTFNACYACHSEFDGLPRAERALWLVKHILFPILRRRYRAWKARNA